MYLFYCYFIGTLLESRPSLSKWKFCVHADKRNLLQQMTSRLCGKEGSDASTTSEILYEVRTTNFISGKTLIVFS